MRFDMREGEISKGNGYKRNSSPDFIQPTENEEVSYQQTKQKLNTEKANLSPKRPANLSDSKFLS